MVLAEHVRIAGRFQRSVRIDTDVQDTSALEGFVCPQTSLDVLLSMARHITENGQGAFTWTGPYGSGKSSLVVALSALLSGRKSAKDMALTAFGEETAQVILGGLPPKKSGWKVIPVVGRRDDPVQAIGEAITAYGGSSSKGWSEKKLISALSEMANEKPSSSGGVLLFIDEMGKFLEGAVQTGGDIYVFQQLAEIASRSGGRLVVVGVLHQAFEEYTNRLSREQRDEWSKVQGRYVDLPINVAGEEQLSLISRAIEFDSHEKSVEPFVQVVANHIRERRSAASANLAEILVGCWPLHPVSACLLGPISRRRFGQNQRSIFGFLNSSEPEGLQDFLRHASKRDLYTPELLWEYLQFNLEPSILASPDGHRWSLAVEAIQRCESFGGESEHLSVLKTIALIDLFRERSGLSANDEVLLASCPNLKKRSLKNVLNQLQKWSLIIYRKFADDFAVFAGSDFDIDKAVEMAFSETHEIELSTLKELSDLQPVLAKRHYHETGALHWFDVDLVPVKQLNEAAGSYKPDRGAIGLFIITVPTEGETDDFCKKAAEKARRLGEDWDVVVGLSPRSRMIMDLTREMWALQFVRKNSQELAGDPVARREVDARTAEVQGRLESELQKALDNAEWYRKNHSPKRLVHAELNGLASDLADKRFNRSPIIFNELLNRLKPSSNAIAAQNALLRRMVLNEGEANLGIEGYPAEGGLFASILDRTGLYRSLNGELAFREPPKGKKDECNLHPIWDAAVKYLTDNEHRAVPVSELYSEWRSAPYGVREGLMPILAVAFMLSRRQNLAFYRQGIFQGRLTDLDIDYLAKDAADIQLRWMDLSETSRELLSEMAEIVRELDETNTLTGLAPIDVARGLIAIYDRLPPWTKKTMRLSRNALQIRQLFNRSKDPNKFLFDDLPENFGGEADLATKPGIRRVVKSVREGLEELAQAYPTMLRRLQDLMLSELQVPNTLTRSLKELADRAENVIDLTGDHRLDAFVSRLMKLDGSEKDIEGLVGLAAEKPMAAWVDTDIDKAAIALTDLSQQFVRSEAFARVKGRNDKRHSMAVVVGVGGIPTPVTGEFDITDRDRADIDSLIERFEEAILHGDTREKNIVLAALAELSAKYLQPLNPDEGEDRTAPKATRLS